MAWHGCSAVRTHRCRMTATSSKGIRATEAPNGGQVEAKTRCRQGRVDLSSPSSRDHRTRVGARREASRGFDRGALWREPAVRVLADDPALEAAYLGHAEAARQIVAPRAGLKIPDYLT